MRVLQLIDSLRSGGAEKMSVSYANALAKRIEGSFLCCTRQEGLLKKQISPEVGYLFLNKKNSLDLQAFRKLRRFVKKNNIGVLQAHSSSWFLALLVKLSLPRLKLVWHDHFGRDLQERKPGLLKTASCFFDGIIAVNRNLKEWSKENLKSKNVKYIPNFFSNDKEIQLDASASPLLGHPDDFKVICLANLRPQKDHFTLLTAFKLLLEQNRQISLHLVGKDLKDDYSKCIKQFISQQELKDKVFLYGEQENVMFFLQHADLGILSSVSEGLPVALLEYGRAGLPVVCTKVGECPAVIGNNGKIIPPRDPQALAEAVNDYFENKELVRKQSKDFKEAVQAQYSEKIVLSRILQFFEEIITNKNE